MASKHLTLRIDADSLARLDEESERTGQNRSELARTLIEEGLRMARHPGIIFREAAMGRRAAVVNAPDVWVFARVFRDQSGSFDEMIRATAALMEQPDHIVRTAAEYYIEFRSEIDGWLNDLDREAERAEDAWLREQARIGA